MNAGVSLTACPCYFPLALRPFRTASERHDSQRVEGSCSVLRVRPEQPVPAPSANDGSAERPVALELAWALVNQARPVAASSVRQARGPAAPAASCQGFAGVATLALIGGAWDSQANKRGRTPRLVILSSIVHPGHSAFGSQCSRFKARNCCNPVKDG